jgi:predicted nuclease of predicted toxin-antitoxin system
VDRDRLLVVDADLPPRLATELRNRARAATSAAHLGLKTAVDPDLL